MESTIDSRTIESEKAREWRESFQAMANDPESTDLEFAFEAQREVVLHDQDQD